MNYGPSYFWAILPWQQNILKTIGARALKLDEQTGSDE